MFQLSTSLSCHSPSNQTEIPKTHNTNCEKKKEEENIGQETIARTSSIIRVQIRPNPERNKPEKFRKILRKIKEQEGKGASNPENERN